MALRNGDRMIALIVGFVGLGCAIVATVGQVFALIGRERLERDYSRVK